ncbi:carboxypeptidase-like regulatory domain-containing protein [Chryseobacterium sp.]|uniref:carboxypeptidase-like regulatory domain-containing protein n=1 Tax=Chryseobacterium sp. TaxID=1871047 RepID=UPI00388F494F
MKIKLLFLLFFFLFLKISAQDYIFGKIVTEEKLEIIDVTVINIRTDERVSTNKDGHFMISGRTGDNLRFIKVGYEREQVSVSTENLSQPINITLKRAAALIQEVEIKKGLTGDLKMDSRTMNPPKKVEKLKSDMAAYISQKSDPRILAAKPGEFVQPKGQGFNIGKVKDKWDDIDLMAYLQKSLGEKYFTDLKINPEQSLHFIQYVLAGGFERKKILKYGYLDHADMNRFHRAVLERIDAYRAPLIKK